MTRAVAGYPMGTALRMIREKRGPVIQRKFLALCQEDAPSTFTISVKLGYLDATGTVVVDPNTTAFDATAIFVYGLDELDQPPTGLDQCEPYLFTGNVVELEMHTNGSGGIVWLIVKPQFQLAELCGGT